MESIRLDLYGSLFAECATLDQVFRVAQEMNNDACLAYVQSGKQEIFSATQVLTANKNESILMKCGNYIANFPGVTPTSQFKTVVFHLDPAAIKKAFGDADLSFLKVDKSSVTRDPALKLDQNVLLDSFVQSFEPYFDDPKLSSEELMATKLRELVLILSDSGKNKIATQIIGTLYTSEQISFEDVIEANLYTNLSNAELAHLSHRSESTFKRDFRKWFSDSPAKYFKTKRLAKAAEMLLNSALKINEIAWECGFENAAHFSDSFHTHYGVSPNNYKN